MQTLREIVMNVYDGSDMLMGQEAIPEETLKKIKEDFNEKI